MNHVAYRERRQTPRVRSERRVLRAPPILALCGVFCGFLALGATVSAQTQAQEYQVKAAFLYHFAQLVDWPAGSLEPSSLSLCVLGDDPFQGELERSVEGKSVGTRSVHVRHVRETKDLRSCQIAFLGKNEDKRLAGALTELGMAPVLTVGDGDTFAQEGGMIGFAFDGNKIRFNINLDSAQRAGLKISSKLLLLAKQVIGNQGGK